MRAWIGTCKETDRDKCQHFRYHKFPYDARCRCGLPAMAECDSAGSFVCGAPICLKHGYCEYHGGEHQQPTSTAELKSAHEWETELGIVIHDADGWRGLDAPSMDDPITRAEFLLRMSMSTISLKGPFLKDLL